MNALTKFGCLVLGLLIGCALGVCFGTKIHYDDPSPWARSQLRMCLDELAATKGLDWSEDSLYPPNRRAPGAP